MKMDYSIMKRRKLSQSPHARSSHLPSILNNSQEREQRNLSEAKSSSASSRTRPPILRRRDNHNRNLRGAGRLQRLETRVINISNQLKRYVKSNNNQKKRRHTIEYPVLPMSIVIENDTEVNIKVNKNTYFIERRKTFFFLSLPKMKIFHVISFI